MSAKINTVVAIKRVGFAQNETSLAPLFDDAIIETTNVFETLGVAAGRRWKVYLAERVKAAFSCDLDNDNLPGFLAHHQLMQEAIKTSAFTE